MVEEKSYRSIVPIAFCAFATKSDLHHRIFSYTQKISESFTGHPILGTQSIHSRKFPKISGYHDKSFASGMTRDHQIIGTNDTSTIFQIGPDLRCMSCSIVVERQNRHPGSKMLNLPTGLCGVLGFFGAIKQLI
ncbi:hypothetical protein AD934_00565 [Gluconobacter oxydans]|uniref:Uncharacterized protein n=1 Tax=Gluconobacter oxydans TaxID=442 RepID=A0A149S928_GLUOY|nr:hypothetical protein AD934_00565 [Gluconobacter oxydans]